MSDSTITRADSAEGSCRLEATCDQRCADAARQQPLARLIRFVGEIDCSLVLDHQPCSTCSLGGRESGGRGAEGQWREAYKVRTRAGGLRQRRASLLNYEFPLTVVTRPHPPALAAAAARPAGGRAGRQARKRRLSLSAARESRRARLAELDINDEALARLAGDGRAWQEAFHSPLARAPRALL